MNYELNVLERLIIVNLVPQRSSALRMRIAQDLQNQVGFDEAEQVLLNFRDEGEGETTRTVWSEVEINTTFDLGPRSVDLIRGQLKAMDEAEEITSSHLSLIDKFEVELDDAD